MPILSTPRFSDGLMKGSEVQPSGGEALFKDMETGEKLSTLPYQMNGDYARAVQSFADTIASSCRQSNIDYHPIDTSMPFDQALYAFLAKRERLY